MNALKYLYVLYSPYLEESKDLYEKTRSYLNDINIRWIPIENDYYSIAGLTENRTPATLAKAINDRVFPEIINQTYAYSISNIAFTGFIYLRAAKALSPQSKDYLPTVLYGNNDQLFVTILPDNLQDKDVKDIISNIPLSIPNTQQPSILELSKKQFKLTKIDEGSFYSNTTHDTVPAFLYPDEQGIEIGAFKYGEPATPFPITGITDNGFIVIDTNGRGN